MEHFEEQKESALVSLNEAEAANKKAKGERKQAEKQQSAATEAAASATSSRSNTVFTTQPTSVVGTSKTVANNGLGTFVF